MRVTSLPLDFQIKFSKNSLGLIGLRSILEHAYKTLKVQRCHMLLPATLGELNKVDSSLSKTGAYDLQCEQ